MQFPTITVKQAAEQVGVSTQRVYQWIDEGIIVPFRPHPHAILLTHNQLKVLKRIPPSKVGRPRISQKRA